MTTASDGLRFALHARRESYRWYLTYRRPLANEGMSRELAHLKQWKERCVNWIHQVEDELGREHRPLDSHDPCWLLRQEIGNGTHSNAA